MPDQFEPPREDTPMPRVLIVDDEADIRETVDMILRYEKYETLLAKNGPEGLALLENWVRSL